jgi:peptidoglycan/xylan/chitin deacetylase (PgdA/CDA1 family)
MISGKAPFFDNEKNRIKYWPLEVYGRLYETLQFEKFARSFLPGGYHVRVICYHDIPERDLPLFDKQIAFFKKEYTIIDARQLKDFFLGRGFLPNANVFITFDDGSADQYKAAEVLDQYKIQACFFVNTGDRDKEFINARPGTKLPPMTWEQIKDLHRRGHIIGSHTVSHANLSRLQPYEIAREMLESKKSLEAAIGDKVEFFAFPYGTLKEISQEALLIAKKFYDFNFIFVPGKSHFASANRFLINRTGIGPRGCVYSLRAVMAGLKDWPKKTECERLRELLC